MWHSSKSLRNWRFLFVQRENEWRSFTCLYARFRTWLATYLLVSHAAVFVSSRNTPPQRGRGSEGGRSVVNQTKTTVFELKLCVLAEQIRSYSGQRLTHPSRFSQPSPSAARDVMGRRKTPCSRRARYAKTTGDEPGSQVKRRTSHVTNQILRGEIYCCRSQVYISLHVKCDVWVFDSGMYQPETLASLT